MSEDKIDGLPENSSDAPQVKRPSLDAKPRESRRTILLVVGGIAVLGCLGLALCAGLFGFTLFQVIAQKPNVEKTVDEFMRAMVAGDHERAYDLFSARSRRQTPFEDIKKLTEGGNYVLFDGYEGVEIQNIQLRAMVNADQNQPQGSVAQVNGNVNYQKGFMGSFSATLEQEGAEWRIHRIDMNVPPDKFSP